jgi:ribonuclease Z
VSEVLFPAAVGGALLPELEMRFGVLTLHGASLAARATAFAVPELGVALDIGRLTPRLAEQPVVLLSHGHLDHLSAVLAYLNLRARFYAGEAPRLYAPEVVAGPLQAALAVMPGMESVRKRLALDELIRVAEPGVPVPLAHGSATPFALDHSVPTLGWALRRRGCERPALVYCADSSTAPFVAEPMLLRAEVAIVECTFVEPNRRIAARLSKHAHVLDWVELAPRIDCGTLVLAHLPAMPSGDLERLLAPLATALRARLVAWTSHT